MFTEDFIELLNENGINEDHPDYNDLLCDFMFNGKDPNEIIDSIHDEVSLISDFGKANSDYVSAPDMFAND